MELAELMFLYFSTDGSVTRCMVWAFSVLLFWCSVLTASLLPLEVQIKKESPCVELYCQELPRNRTSSWCGYCHVYYFQSCVSGVLRTFTQTDVICYWLCLSRLRESEKEMVLFFLAL